MDLDFGCRRECYLVHNIHCDLGYGYEDHNSYDLTHYHLDYKGHNLNHHSSVNPNLSHLYITGTGPGNYVGLCDFCWHYGYCPPVTTDVVLAQLVF